MSKKRASEQIAYGILKPMKVGRKQKGFTIVETMIVLAVSGALFLSAALAISGRQARQEFTQSIQDARSQIQEVMNEVASGFYPSMGNLSCTPGGSGPSFSTTAIGQGENTGCISLGKAIHFDTTTTPQSMNVFTIAGLQKTSSTGPEVKNLSEAMPKVIAPASGAPNLTEEKPLLYGLRVKSVTDTRTGGAIGAVAVVSSLAPYNSVGIASGSQRLLAYPVNNTSRSENQSTTATKINTNLATSTVISTQGVTVCFEGGSGQTGLVTIGGASRQLSVTLEIKTC